MPGEEGGDMRFLLPGGPSPAALAALLSACRELDRAGAPSMLMWLQLYSVVSQQLLPHKGNTWARRSAQSVSGHVWPRKQCRRALKHILEINAGGHWPGSPTLALLEWELAGAAVAALGSLQGGLNCGW